MQLAGEPDGAAALNPEASTAGALHDFNNAVQMMAASLHRLERRVALGKTGELLAMIAAVSDQVTRVGSLGATLARAAPGGAQAAHPAIPVGPFVHAMAEQVAALLDGTVRLEVAVEDGTGHVACDPARLESAILNLVLNARDAMPDGGVLALRAAVTQPGSIPGLSAGPAADPGGPDGTRARFAAITVADTGHGMNADMLRRCFEPFVTTKAAHGGTGLGLYQLRAFATEMGGTVRLRSQAGHGTEATILLPCTAPTSA